MDNKCPKCDGKLSFFYLKQDCPHCGCDLVYYDMDNRLKKDEEQAEAEFAKLEGLLSKFRIKKSKKK